jgi:hypothetical protein
MTNKQKNLKSILENLSEEQRKLITIVRDKRISLANSGIEIDKSKVEEGIKMIYELA